MDKREAALFANYSLLRGQIAKSIGGKIATFGQQLFFSDVNLEDLTWKSSYGTQAP